jgi:hypothetical protein
MRMLEWGREDAKEVQKVRFDCSFNELEGIHHRDTPIPAVWVGFTQAFKKKLKIIFRSY